MKIKELLVAGFTFVKEAAKKVVGKVVEFVAGANIVTLGKAAVGAGIVLGTAVMVVNFFKEKYNMMKKAKEEKQPVDQILDQNYTDYRKKPALRRVRGMRKVSDTIYTDKPRKKKRTSMKNKDYKWIKKFIKKSSKKDKKRAKKKTFWDNRDFDDIKLPMISELFMQEDSTPRTYWNAV